MLEGLRMR